ncbi:MAG: hypothetical protein LC797_18305 [Chloroflexi bacterium]|nr:hypothetical protein [Chloroflexota bacterium]
MQVVGRIIAVQEQRFRLLTDEGQVYGLTLSRGSRLDASVLSRLHADQARVTVEYSGESNLTGGVARNVLLVGAGCPGHSE